MKKNRMMCMWLFMLILLGSCLDGPLDTSGPVPWLCSINADGTGFRKIRIVDSSLVTTGLSDIYMTKDNRIIFYGDKLWISDTDIINPVQITPDSLLTERPYRLTQSSDGTKLFFSANKNIYQLDYPSYHLTKLTNETSSSLRNPILSRAGNILTFMTYTQINHLRDYSNYVSYLNLESMEVKRFPELGQYNSNVVYNTDDGLLYYDGNQGLFSVGLDGTNNTQIKPEGGYASHRYGLTSDQRYLVRARGCLTITDLITGYQTSIETGEDYSGNTLYALNMSNNFVFYTTIFGEIFIYDIDNRVAIPVLQGISGYAVNHIYMLAPTWDGTKVYFYCEMERNGD